MTFIIYSNLYIISRKIIKQSHPSCNNLMLVGIILCLLAIIPLGLDGRFVSPALFPVACGTTSWLLTLGFTLAFGAMFSKIWRVHRLTTKSKADASKTVSINTNDLAYHAANFQKNINSLRLSSSYTRTRQTGIFFEDLIRQENLIFKKNQINIINAVLRIQLFSFF